MIRVLFTVEVPTGDTMTTAFPSLRNIGDHTPTQEGVDLLTAFAYEKLDGTLLVSWDDYRRDYLPVRSFEVIVFDEDTEEWEVVGKGGRSLMETGESYLKYCEILNKDTGEWTLRATERQFTK